MNNAVKQLVRDLKQLELEPIVGANARPLDNDMMKWYGIVVGVGYSPYAGIPIRFVLEFSNSYPDAAPKAFFETYVRYVGGASYQVDGRMAVCLNIFGNFGEVHTEWKNMSEGWSPSYSVSTILVAMQGLMMSEMLSMDPVDINKCRESAISFKCGITKHNGEACNKWFPSVILSEEELNNYKVKNNITVGKKFSPLKDHYICYVKKISLGDVIDGKNNMVLGYGVNIDNVRNGTLSSPCEYLSLEAFDDGIRRSSTNRPFMYWIPILINNSMWNDNIKKLFQESIIGIGKGLGSVGTIDPSELALKICSSIMNTLVVEIMNNKNNLSANDKFIDGYFAMYRLLKQLVIEKPSIENFVDNRLKYFIQSEGNRTKESFPNLGELLIYLTISKRYSWNDIKQMFLEECDARNVFWYAVGNYNCPPACPDLLNTSIVENRAVRVFKATEISRNLVMFQVKFSEIARLLTFEIMESNFGLAPQQLRTELRGTYNEIIKIVDWNGYLKWLRLPETNNDVRAVQLIAAVKLSEKNRYHTQKSVNKNNRRY